MNPPWYEVFRCTEEQLKDVAFNILNVYIHEPQSKEQLEEIIQKLKDQLLEAKAKAKTESVTAASAGASLTHPHNSTVSGSNPSAAIASAHKHNNNNSINSVAGGGASTGISGTRRDGSHSNHQSPNSKHC